MAKLPTVIAPLSVNAPPVVTVRFWPTLTVPKSRAFTSVSETSLVPLLLRLTAPLKSFEALLRVIALAPAVKLEARSASIAPVWVIAPPEVTLKAPVAVIPAIEVAVVSTKVTAAPVRFTAPVKSLPVPDKSIVWPAALTVKVPSMSMSPRSVTDPVEVIERLFTFNPD